MQNDILEVNDDTIEVKTLTLSVDNSKRLWRLVDLALNTGGLPQDTIDFGNELKPKLPNPNG